MNLINYLLTIIGSSITIFMELLSFSKISNKLFNKSFKNILLIILAGLLVAINIYTMDNALIRTLISFTILLTIASNIFDGNLSEHLFYTIIVYIVATMFEIILAVINFKINILDYEAFENNIIVKSIFSFLTLLMTYLTLNSKYAKKIINKKNIHFKYNKILIIIFVISLIVLFIADFNYINTFSKNTYIGNIILVLCLIFLVTISIFNYIKLRQEAEKSEILLNFISNYEKIIDEDRINRHEMLNNLVTLKVIKNKNSKTFDNYLTELINNYNKTNVGFKNLYELPSGLKGIFYYKLNGLENNNYKLNINISKQISGKLEKIDDKKYTNICRIVGILLDNAIEASEQTNDKYIGIEVYKEKSNIIISIENSFSGKINLKNINNKYYSTKGNRRGYGLFILNSIIKGTDGLDFEQKVYDNIFCSKIIIH